jgi:S1-C subfamily serine protease
MKHTHFYITLGAIWVILFVGTIFGVAAYVTYDKFEERLEATRAENIAIQNELNASIAETRTQAQEAQESAAELSVSLQEEKKKSVELADDLEQTKVESKQQIALMERKVAQVSIGTDSSELVAEWGPMVGFIYCVDSQGSGWSGSGTALNMGDGTVVVLTNYHVLKGASLCAVKFPDDSDPYVVYSSDFRWDSSDLDWGFMTISSPTYKLLQASRSWAMCPSGRGAIGDKLIILGYPGVGAQSTITVTQGIISGFDPDNFVTDAKIDHGNSGGAAILVEENCFLGIPSAAFTGEIESYGRILDINAIFPSL